MRLLIYSEAWGKGGIESFIKNEVPFLMSRGVKVEIFSTWCWPSECSGESVKGVVVQHIVFRGHRPNLVIRTFLGALSYLRVLHKGRFDAVHINTMNGMGFLYSQIARWCGVPIRIVHSHNTNFGSGSRRAKELFHQIGIRLFSASATHRLACSKAAGEYLFYGKEFKVINNGIKINNFRFNELNREKIRDKFGIEGSARVLGFVGRLSEQKNPLFAVSVFKQCYLINRNCRFLVVGSGELNHELKEAINSLKMDKVVFQEEAVENIGMYYAALDALVMPSLYEGLPITAIEAQCSGLPILCSENITQSVKITDLVSFESLDRGSERWANDLLEIASGPIQRTKYYRCVEDAGYSDEECLGTLEDILRGVAK